jgi:molecular chaperone DnaK (HSP70)
MVLKECEKVKKMLTTLNQATFSIDCLTEDITINQVIDRVTFDKITQCLILDIMECLNHLIKGLNLDLIDSVELLGGSMRIPKIKEVIKTRLNKELSFTLNAEESISKGCVIYGAINSPIIKNANYKIERFFEEELIMELSHYKNPVVILEKGNNIIPFERKITFNFSDNFNINFKSELNEVMSFYQVNILNNISDKKKIEILLEFKLDNQIIIKDYKIYDDTYTKLDIKQIYQAKLNDNDIENINKTYSDIRLKEERIDNFYDVINYLENLYYNKFDEEFLNDNEKSAYQTILEFINKNLIEDIPEIETFETLLKHKTEIIKIENKIKHRMKELNNFSVFLNEINNKLYNL